MVALGLVLQVAAASPPETARLHLARGDTAAAVAALLPLASTRDTVTSDGLAALFLLQWIGRSPPQRRARDAWRAAGAAVNLLLVHGPAAGVLLGAVVVDEGEVPVDKELRGQFGALTWTHWVSFLRHRAADADPALAGGAAWALVQRHLWDLRFAIDAVPPWDTLPTKCRVRVGRPGATFGIGSRVASCTVRGRPPAGATLAEIVAAADGGRLLTALHANLDAARGAPWPYNEMAARTRLVLEAFTRDSAALAALADDTAGLGEHTVREIRVVAFEMSGRRHAAAREMAADSARFAGLDRDRRGLGSSGLPDDIFWQAAWSLFLEPYNARLVAHRARVLLADIVRRAGPDDAGGALGSTGDPELLVRVGIPRALRWVRGGAPGGADDPVPVLYAPAGLHETLVRASKPTSVPSLDLALAARDDEHSIAAPSGYEALDYDRLLPLDHQVFQYLRAGQRIVAFHAFRPGAFPCARSAPRVGLFMLDQRLRVRQETVQAPPPEQERFLFRQAMVDGTHVYSLEYLDRGCRVAARARYVLTLGGPGYEGISGLALADTALLDAPRRIDGEPLMAARPSLRVRGGEAVHLYWEMYGLEGGAPHHSLAITLEILNVARQRVPVSALSRLAAAARNAPKTQVAYQALVPEGQGPVAFALSVRLRGEATGVLVARLEIKDPATGRTYRVERPFSVSPAVELRPGGR